MAAEYDDEQRALSNELACKLADLAQKATGCMSDHAIATAFLGVGVAWAVGRAAQRERSAEWLRQVADEIERSAPTRN